ncbi:MAG: AraC family transcriptional regulator [Anaerolineales bacterium]|nr:AraC family transcriptional regulator [Anaerolineales bacterium]
MNTGRSQQTVRDAQRANASREELVERIASIHRYDGEIEPLPGIYLGRVSAPLERVHSVLEPSFCVIAQGSKVVFVGDNCYQYDPFNYCLSTLELPRVSHVLDASKERPYLSFRLALDPNQVSSIMIEAGHVMASGNANVRAIDVGLLDTELLDAVVRLVRLVDSSSGARVIMPLIKREIIYRLLISEQGDRLCHLTISGGYASNIARAVEQIRRNFNQTLRVEDLAQELGMSISSFYQHFKSVTAMSPLQFQKRLRIQEARRLMLGEDLDATSAAYRVGYNDSSHFSREYKSIFGEPPVRNVGRLREATIANGGLKVN